MLILKNIVVKKHYYESILNSDTLY